MLFSDLKALEAYFHQDSYGKLPCSITALGGESDVMANEAELRAWADCAESRPSVFMFPGSHYFFSEPETKEVVVQLVANILELVSQPETQRTARNTARSTTGAS